jgi:DNA-binding MarR family transcriptional regulator
VFAHIDVEGGTRLTTLASRATMTPQALGELVDDLERLGYVKRRPDPDDRRAKRIVLTRRGRRAVAAGQETIAQMEADLRAAIGDKRLEALHAVLRDLVEHAARDS